MGSARRPITTKGQCSRSDQTGPNHSDRAGPSLPPKPDLQKNRRSRSSAVMPPPSHASPAPRRTWSRRSASWTPEEDAKLVELVKKEASIPPSITASKTWSRVAAQLTNRTGKQCRERYLNQLKPGIRRDPWSLEEEEILRLEHAKLGNKWVLIASKLPGRTDNCVKNHWNSMLRKRQRRQNALDAAQAEVTAALGGTQVPQKVARRIGDVDVTDVLRTGCATPSGLSSSYHDVRSGVPSPYNASSPITPRRDSKLQISNLVASSTKELPNWNSTYVGKPTSIGRFGNEYSGFSTDGRNGVIDPGRNMFHSVSSSRHTYGPYSPLIKLPSPVNAVLGNGGVQRNASFLPKEVVASPMRGIGSSQVPQLIQNGRLNGGEVKAVRRSSRLGSCSGGREVTSELGNNVAVGDMQKKVIDNGSDMKKATNAAALVALADAASSVPPSPLTPESSRYSTTGRSRSVSPVPRLWSVHGNCVAGSNGTGVVMTRRRVAELSGLNGTDGRLANQNGRGKQDM